jgi:hypothetical protein
MIFALAYFCHSSAVRLAFSVLLLLQKKTIQECEPLMSNTSFEERRFALESLLS